MYVGTEVTDRLVRIHLLSGSAQSKSDWKKEKKTGGGYGKAVSRWDGRGRCGQL